MGWRLDPAGPWPLGRPCAQANGPAAGSQVERNVQEIIDAIEPAARYIDAIGNSAAAGMT
jgi:hypothetical protein